MFEFTGLCWDELSKVIILSGIVGFKVSDIYMPYLGLFSFGLIEGHDADGDGWWLGELSGDRWVISYIEVDNYSIITDMKWWEVPRRPTALDITDIMMFQCVDRGIMEQLKDYDPGYESARIMFRNLESIVGRFITLASDSIKNIVNKTFGPSIGGIVFEYFNSYDCEYFSKTVAENLEFVKGVILSMPHNGGVESDDDEMLLFYQYIVSNHCKWFDTMYWDGK
jgi:hypothetical protein